MMPDTIECIIDSHVHLPINPPLTPNILMKEIQKTGIKAAVILGMPAVKSLLDNLSHEQVRREHERVQGFISKYHHNPWEFHPDSLLVATLRLISSYGRLCSYKPAGDNYRVLAAADLTKNPDELARELEKYATRGFAGFKVISTIFMKYLDDPSVEAVFEVAESRNLPIVVHAGCDPGVWELPGYCKYGDPSRLQPLIDSHRDVTVIIAHIGSYSYLAPGVFLEETLELVKRYGNVYVDTSAVPPTIIRAAASVIPPDRMVFGSDYPVVDNVDIPLFITDVYRALRSAGYSIRDVNKVFWENSSNIFGLRC